MENIADALKMAGSIILFTIALATAILAFTQARVAVDAVLQFSDREFITLDSEKLGNKSSEELYKNYYYLSDTSKLTRNVRIRNNDTCNT